MRKPRNQMNAKKGARRLRIGQNCSGNLSFMDGHAQTFKWKGQELRDWNAKYSADDSISQRGSPDNNPCNGLPWNPNDKDYIRLALTAPNL